RAVADSFSRSPVPTGLRAADGHHQRGRNEACNDGASHRWIAAARSLVAGREGDIPRCVRYSANREENGPSIGLPVLVPFPKRYSVVCPKKSSRRAAGWIQGK